MDGGSAEDGSHILDGGHMLLETHAVEAASIIVDFIKRTHHTEKDWRA